MQRAGRATEQDSPQGILERLNATFDFAAVFSADFRKNVAWGILERLNGIVVRGVSRAACNYRFSTNGRSDA